MRSSTQQIANRSNWRAFAIISSIWLRVVGESIIHAVWTVNLFSLESE